MGVVSVNEGKRGMRVVAQQCAEEVGMGKGGRGERGERGERGVEKGRRMMMTRGKGRGERRMMGKRE